MKEKNVSKLAKISFGLAILFLPLSIFSKITGIDNIILSIITIITFLGSIILGIISLIEIKQKNLNGKLYAILGILIPICFITITIIIKEISYYINPPSPND